jgi:hypothetical protein
MPRTSAIPDQSAETSAAAQAPDPSGFEDNDSEDPGSGDNAARDRKRRWWMAPFRFVRNVASAFLRPVGNIASAILRPIRELIRPIRALIRSPFRLAKTVFMATIGRDRGFGFWWLVVTLALAVAIGLIVGVVLSPVLGLLAAIGVGIWMLVRRSGSSDSDEPDDADQQAAAGLGHSTR